MKFGGTVQPKVNKPFKTMRIVAPSNKESESDRFQCNPFKISNIEVNPPRRAKVKIDLHEKYVIKKYKRTSDQILPLYEQLN
jgi:hypothetical protein